MKKDILKNKTVLITGGTGSLGQKLAERILMRHDVRKLVIFSRDEYKQHRMKQETHDPRDRLRFFLGDVRDLPRLQRALYGADIIIHAAALKQVPALEYNPLEAIKTNVLGAQNVIDAALDAGVARVLFVSTDKAVNPANLYGATKLCAEKLFVAANAYRRSGTAPPVFSVVRYGNVVGSRGSIVDVVREQKERGTVTLTDKRMTRFWITFPRAIDLIMDALSRMRGGEVFVPKLSAMKVTDVLAALAPKASVKVIGIRPGEKLHEVLLTDDEVRRARDGGACYIVLPHERSAAHRVFGTLPPVPPDFVYASNAVQTVRKEDFLRLV